MENLIDFFTIQNKAGAHTREKFILNKYPDLFFKIKQYSLDKGFSEIPFKDKIYLFINNIDFLPKCKTCGIDIFLHKSISDGYKKYCSVKCMNQNQERKEKIKNNNLIQFGVESHNQLETVKNNKIKSNINKYGVDNPMKNNDIKVKLKNTLLNKYGVDNPMKIDYIINN
jgi:hypothetical protein